MKVLFLPENIASMPAITAKFLNRNNTQAVCITNTIHKYQTITPEIIYLNKKSSNNKIINKVLQYIWRRTTYKKEIKKWIEWADVLHYVWSPALKDGEDLAYAAKLKKPIFIEWVGSDIRNPDLLKSINSYYKKAYHNGYEYAAYESEKKSEQRQKLFSKFQAIPLLSPEMCLYASRALFPEIKLLYQRLNIKDFTPVFPDSTNKRPLIIHSPSAKIAKGSNYIIPIIEDLKKEFDFDFKMLHDMPRAEVLAQMQRADIYIDQIIIGSYGMATMEAMSFGKPVLCYIMPEVYEAGLSYQCPIVNSNPDNLKQKLTDLLQNPELRHEIGRKSRTFAEEHHDVEKIAKDLIIVYENALNKLN
jgi:glycosyltransferase involved in cell wall biosynthesis